MTEPILSVDDLQVTFPVSGRGWFAAARQLKAVAGVSFTLGMGETLGVVGESGCGKSTLGRALLGLIPSHSGRVLWRGQELTALSPKRLRRLRRELQIVFQDPLAALNPRLTVAEIVAEPLRVHEPRLTKRQRRERVAAMMARVGLLSHQLNRYPHEFSGGQCQRIGIARAMILNPKLVVCDEPVSALDVSIQAQIVNLLMSLQRDLGLSLIFISHDLSVVRHISHHVLVLYLGRIMEVAERDALYEQPRHPYTKALISAVPVPDPALQRQRQAMMIGTDLPSLLDPPSGCVFRTRCPRADRRCAEEIPALEGDDGHRVACHHWRDFC